MEENIINFIQQNSPDGGFLQSDYWRKFQEAVGRKTYNISETGEEKKLITQANIIEHTLPIAGKYFYVPRGPIVSEQRTTNNEQFFDKNFRIFLSKLLSLAEKNNAGWIRIEPASEKILQEIKENLPENIKIKKSSVDMQSREILVMDISGSEEEILAGMKQKTRYNIRLAQKRGVRVTCNTQHVTQENIEKFLRLVRITAERDKITSHPESYYRKMFETIPSNILKLYIAEYEGKAIAANLVLFFGESATYLHGASASEHRNVMAPYLLQWRAIQDAKKAGCERYDLGGVKTCNTQHVTCNTNSWAGITKFKTGFALNENPIQFPGSYDIIMRPAKYNLYRALQKIKKVI